MTTIKSNFPNFVSSNPLYSAITWNLNRTPGESDRGTIQSRCESITRWSALPKEIDLTSFSSPVSIVPIESQSFVNLRLQYQYPFNDARSLWRPTWEGGFTVFSSEERKKNERKRVTKSWLSPSGTRELTKLPPWSIESTEEGERICHHLTETHPFPNTFLPPSTPLEQWHLSKSALPSPQVSQYYSLVCRASVLAILQLPNTFPAFGYSKWVSQGCSEGMESFSG